MATKEETENTESTGTTEFSVENYEKLIQKLNEEKDRIERELRQEYRNARRYVRTHPEQGLAAAFAGGLIAGVVIAKIFSK